jgi:hypothetical protein
LYQQQRRGGGNGVDAVIGSLDDSALPEAEARLKLS